MKNEQIQEIIQHAFNEDCQAWQESFGMLTLHFNRHRILDLLIFLREHPELKMHFLTDVCGMHLPNQKDAELCAVYHIQNMHNRTRLRIKCFMPALDAEIDSITSIYRSANWQERETFDFYGIKFKGHPELTRILNADEMDYHPLLKEYPLEDQTRTDKNDSYFGR